MSHVELMDEINVVEEVNEILRLSCEKFDKMESLKEQEDLNETVENPEITGTAIDAMTELERYQTTFKVQTKKSVDQISHQGNFIFGSGSKSEDYVSQSSSKEEDAPKPENEKKSCHCFSTEKINKESPEQHDNDVKEEDSVQIDVDVCDENLIPLKSSVSLMSAKISEHLVMKNKSVDDLTKKASELKEQSDLLQSKYFEAHPAESYGIENNVVTVASIPAIITRSYHPSHFDDTKQAVPKESDHSLKSGTVIDVSKNPSSIGSPKESIDSCIDSEISQIATTSKDSEDSYQPIFQMQPEVPQNVSRNSHEGNFVFGTEKNPKVDDMPVVKELYNSMPQNTEEAAAIAVQEKKSCHCFMTEQVDNEICEQHDEDMKKAKSVELGAVASDETLVPSNSYISLLDQALSEHSMKKFENVQDLTKVDSKLELKSQSGMLKSEDLDEHLVRLQSKYPAETTVVTVSSIPAIITRYYHTDDVQQATLNELKSGTVVQKITDDDDGYLDLPKVPSNTLSEASSSAWIDENITFAPDRQNLILNSALKVAETINETITEILEEFVPIQVTDETCVSKETVEMTEPSTSIPRQKRHSNYCKCKNYIKRVSRALFGRRDKN